jgi:hypothetical protein
VVLTDAERYASDVEAFGAPAVVDELGRFVAELYRDAERGELSFVTGQANVPHWHGLEVDALAAAARQQAGDVWVPIASRVRRLPGRKRGGADDVLDVFAVAVDLDVNCAHHERTDLPPTLDDATSLLADFPLVPTVIDATGGGLQAWWFLAEPSPATEVLEVLGRWGANWRELGRRRGWHVDNTSSVEHVFRLPGTLNTRAGSVVTIEHADYGRRFGLDDLDEACVEETVPPRPKPSPRPRLDGERLAGDRYNAAHTCDELLEAAGCVLSHVARSTGDRHYFAPHRAETKDKTGATVYADGHCAIYSETFARSQGLPTALGDRRTLDAFGLYARLEHGGDFSAAAKAIAKQDPPTTTTPPNVNPETGEILDPRPPLPDEFWAHPRLAHVRRAAHARGRAPVAVLACVLARVAAELDHVYVLPPIVGADGSLNLAVALVAATGSGKSSSDGIAEELLRFDTTLDCRPRGLPLGSGEGVAEAYMGTRTATEDEQAAGLGKTIREQMRWNELFIGDEGQAIVAAARRNGATLLPTLRTLVTGGPLGQQNAASDNRRRIPAHGYRAAVLLGFQTATAVELLDDAAGGTPARFLFAAATDPTIPAPADRPEWPGTLTVSLPGATWRETLERGRGARRRIPVCAAAIDEVTAEDHRRSTGGHVAAVDAHRDLVRLQIAAHLGVLLDGHPAVTDETWRLAGHLTAHSRVVVAGIEAHAAGEVRLVEQATSDRLAARAVNAAAKQEAWRVVECARRIARRVRAEPGITRGEVRGELRRWRDEFDDGLDHALDHGWVTEHSEAGQGQGKRVLHPGEERP